jgi:cation-transporting ATPase E
MVILLSIISVVTVSEYPLMPKNLLLLVFFIIGGASLLLALEPNNKRIEGNYLDSVIIRSTPNALAMLVPVIVVLIAGKFMSITSAQRDSIIMCVILLVGFINLFALCRPYTKWRAGVVSAVGVALIAAILVSIFLLDDMLGFTVIWRTDAEGNLNEITMTAFGITMGIGVVFAFLMQLLRFRIEKLIAHSIEKQKEREAKRRAESGNI